MFYFVLFEKLHHLVGQAEIVGLQDDVLPPHPFGIFHFAGIHADGLLKNEEIYNIFDTEKFLRRPPVSAVSNTSGLAGIAHWMNHHYHLKGDSQLDKKDVLVIKLKEWVDKQYDEGRVTVLTDNELENQINVICEEYGMPLFI